MALTVKHNTLSTVTDLQEPGIIGPDEWNEDHSLTGEVPVANGGTGADNATQARINLGVPALLDDLSDVDVTSASHGEVLTLQSGVWMGTSAGSGDVAGPASAADGDAVLFDGTTGKLVKTAGAAPYVAGGTDVPIADGGTGASDAATAFSNLKQAASESATGVVEEATAAEILAGTADKFIECEKLEDSMEPVALSDGANISVDLSTGVYFTVTLGGNRTLDNPSNHKIGRTVAVRVTQDGGGNRTLSYGTQYDFGQDSAPVLSTAGGTVDVLFFWVLSSSKMVYLGIRKDV